MYTSQLHLQYCATKRQSVKFARTTVILTSSNQAEIWFVASHAQGLGLNEISEHLDMLSLSYRAFPTNFWNLGDFLKKCVFQHIFSHLSDTTLSDCTEFFIRAGFVHGLPHTKLQPLRLKDAEVIGWCG